MKNFKNRLFLSLVMLVPTSIDCSLPKKPVLRQMTKNDEQQASSTLFRPTIKKINPCGLVVACCVLLGESARASVVEAADSYQPSCSITPLSVPPCYSPHIVSVHGFANPTPLCEDDQQKKQQQEFVVPAQSTEKDLMQWFFNLGYKNEYNYAYRGHHKNSQYYQGSFFFKKQEWFDAYLAGVNAAGRVKNAEWYQDLHARLEYEKNKESQSVFFKQAQETKKNK
jgi:hypothetical protein